MTLRLLNKQPIKQVVNRTKKALAAAYAFAAIGLTNAMAAESEMATSVKAKLTALEEDAVAILSVAILITVAFKVFGIGKKGINRA